MSYEQGRLGLSQELFQLAKCPRCKLEPESLQADLGWCPSACVSLQVAGRAAGVCGQLHRPVCRPVCCDLPAQPPRWLGGPLGVLLTAGKRRCALLGFLVLLMREPVVRFLGLCFESCGTWGEGRGQVEFEEPG